jgi:hypothetical protein
MNPKTSPIFNIFSLIKRKISYDVLTYFVGDPDKFQAKTKNITPET